MSYELKPCPFCGGEASWFAARQREDGAYYPAACGCRKCGIWHYGESDYGHGGFATEKDRKVSMKQAASKWNTRADVAQVIENAKNYKLTDDFGPQVIVNAEKHESADEPPLDRLLRCLENDYGILAEYDGLRRVWYTQRVEPLPVDSARDQINALRAYYGAGKTTMTDEQIQAGMEH